MEQNDNAQHMNIGDYQPRQSPHNNDAERAVLGALLLDGNAIAAARRLMPDPAALYRDAHRAIYRAMLKLSEQGCPIELITVNDELRRAGDLADIGGAHYLTALHGDTFTASNIEHYIRIVQEAAFKRRIISECSAVVEGCYEPGADSFELIGQATETLYSLTDIVRKGGAQASAVLVREAMEHIQSLRDRRAAGETVFGVPSGFAAIDRMSGGFQKSDLIILAARPSMGKTALALAIARNAAREGFGVGFYSLEMAALQLIARLLSREGMVDLRKIRTGSFTDEEFNELCMAAAELSRMGLFIDDASSISISDLALRVRELKRRQDIQMLVVDYLQLMHAKAESREREIGMISRGLKRLAKELDIPIIALSQLSRNSEHRTDKKPMLSDLRESGNIEQDADVVMFVHRPQYYGINVDENGNSTEGIAEIIFAKQRNGPTGDVQLAFLKEHASFRDLAIQDNAPQYLLGPEESHYNRNGYGGGAPF